MTKGIKGYNTAEDKPDFEEELKKIYGKPAYHFKKLYLRAMMDLDGAGVITFLDRELIEDSVGEGKMFASFTALGIEYGFFPAEISHIRNGGRKMKSPRIRVMISQLEKLKRNQS